MPETTITINLQGREQVRQAIQSVKTQLDSIKPNFLALTAAAGGLAGAIALIGKKALDEAGDIEKFTATMRTITGSTKEAANMIQFAIKAATQTPFEVKGVVESTATIMQFTKMLGWTGKDAQKWFPLIGDLAAGMGKDLHYTSLVMGKALTGSQDAILSLRDQFGISAQALKAFGAEINKEGGIAVRTAEQQEKLRNALEALIKQNFAGAMARQMDTFQGAMSNLRDALSRVYMAIGKEMIPIFNRWVKESLTPTLEKVENFVKENGKLVIAVGATVGAVSMIVAGLAGLGFILPPLIGGLKALQVLFAVQIPQALAISTTALKTFVFAHPLIAGLTLAITGLTTAFISLKSETDAKIKKFEEDREKTEELIREYNELITIIGKTTEQKERQKAIIEELIKLLPEYADKFRELKGEPIKNIEEINKQLLAQYNLIIQNMTLSEKWGRHLITIFELVTVTIRQAIETAITGLIGFITLLVKMIVDFCKTSLVLIGDFIAGIEGIFKGDFSKIKKAGKNIGEAFTSGTKESFGKHLVEFET
ncbi:MAG: tape measure protein, partial [Bacillota bacterium]